jgi:Fe2+ or Zn2+ uptake regulation protein
MKRNYEELSPAQVFGKMHWFTDLIVVQRQNFLSGVKCIRVCPGQMMIQEGTTHEFMYLLVKGECNLIRTNTSDIFHSLEIEDDPTFEKRQNEKKKL